MTSYVFVRPFECAPHATRSVALALALSLNLAIVLFALRPSTPFVIHAPPPESLLATVLQPPPPPIQPPAVPTLHVAKHVMSPIARIATPHPVPIRVTALPSIAPIAQTELIAVTTTPGSDSMAASGNSDATIAYATATPPAYPIPALRAGIQGTVMLKVLVDPNGKPLQVAIERSSGSRLLDDAARKHVLAAWRFHPAMRDGHAIEAWALVPVRFDLNRY